MSQTSRPTALTTDEWAGAFTDVADNDDATYLQSPQSPVESQVFVCALSEVSSPGVYTGHQIRVRANAYPSLSTAHALVLDLENVDDGSVVATRTYSPVPDAVEDEVLALTEAEAALIHDYAGLRIKGRGKLTTGTAVAFVWDDVVGATSYVLQVGTSSGNYNRSNSNVGNVLTMELTLSPGTYFSRVVPVGAGSATAERQVVVT